MNLPPSPSFHPGESWWDGLPPHTSHAAKSTVGRQQSSTEPQLSRLLVQPSSMLLGYRGVCVTDKPPNPAVDEAGGPVFHKDTRKPFRPVLRLEGEEAGWQGLTWHAMPAAGHWGTPTGLSRCQKSCRPWHQAEEERQGSHL